MTICIARKNTGWVNAGTMLGQRRRRWPNIETALGVTFAEILHTQGINQCLFNVLPASAMLARHQTSIG